MRAGRHPAETAEPLEHREQAEQPAVVGSHNTNLEGYAMKRQDISKRFTEIVTEYIGKGYVFNTTTMSGSQGEDAKVDLTNGKEVIRVLLDRFSEPRHEGLLILVGRAQADIEPSNDRYDNIWSSKLEPVSEERFYEIGSARGGRKFYGTKEESATAHELRFRRWSQKNQDTTIPLPEAAKGIALRWVQKQPKHKSVKLSDIEEVYISLSRGWKGKTTKRYYVRYRGRTMEIR